MCTHHMAIPPLRHSQQPAQPCRTAMLQNKPPSFWPDISFLPLPRSAACVWLCEPPVPAPRHKQQVLQSCWQHIEQTAAHAAAFLPRHPQPRRGLAWGSSSA